MGFIYSSLRRSAGAFCFAEKTRGQAVCAPIFSACIWPICDSVPQLHAVGRRLCAGLPPAARRQRAGQDEHPRSHGQSLFAFACQVMLHLTHDEHGQGNRSGDTRFAAAGKGKVGGRFARHSAGDERRCRVGAHHRRPAPATRAHGAG